MAMPEEQLDADPGIADVDGLIDGLFGPSSTLARQIDDYEPRPVQAQMARLVTKAVLHGQRLLVEAPTGTGKTLAYLLPLLALGKRLVVSTATKALQDQIVTKDIPLLKRTTGRPFSAAVLKGRGNYLCRHRHRIFEQGGFMVARRERDWIAPVRAWAQRTGTGDRDEIANLPERLAFWPDISAGGDHCPGRRCADYDHCYLTLARNRARKVDLVVVNHHLYFADLSVKEGGFGDILPEHDQVVFDEAHRIPDVVTQFFGMEISNYKLRELAGDCRREFDAVGADDAGLLALLPLLEETAKRLRGAFPEENGRDGLSPADLEREAGRALVAVEGALYQLVQALEPHRIRSPGMAAIGRRAEMLLDTSGRIRTLEDPQRVYWYETRGRGVFLSASPLETGPTLRELLYPRVRSVVFTSATLATGSGTAGFSFFLNHLGLSNQEVISHRLPPSFDYERQSLLYLPTQLPDPGHDAFAEAAVASIRALLLASSGRALCLFTSFRMMETVRDGLYGQIPYTLLVQGEGSKNALLKTFRNDHDSVLLGVASFWEGVDVPGESLSIVIIDRLPFASPADPMVAARSRWLQANGLNPFMEMSLPRAILSLKQGLGRLLRGRNDRGVMVVLDGRLQRKWYGRRFLAGLPATPITHDLEAVYRFFS